MTVFPFLLCYFYLPLRWWKQHRFNTLTRCEVSKVLSSASCSNQISQNPTPAAQGVYFFDLSSVLQPSHPGFKICVWFLSSSFPTCSKGLYSQYGQGGLLWGCSATCAAMG